MQNTMLRRLLFNLLVLILLAGCAFAPPHMPNPEAVPYTSVLSGLPGVTKDTKIIILSDYYVLPTDNEVLTRIGALPYHNYQPDTANCKDFAREAYGACAFTGWPVFIVLEKEHVYIG